MKKPTQIRSSGILAHISSLPSPHGIGDIGHSSWNFLEFLQKSGQTLWQFLPTVPTNPIFDNSPYMGNSAFAGSPLLLSMDLLVEDGLLSKIEMKPDYFSEYQTAFQEVTRFKKSLLQSAFKAFATDDKQFLAFQKDSIWLHDFCLFMSLKDRHKQKGWFDWPVDIATRTPEALARESENLTDKITYYAFEQFIFHKQWKLLQQKAKSKNIRLIGDIPIYVGWDSADVWANQDIFELNKKTHTPVNVAGVPPDYFSKTGQRWGNPLYCWHSTDKKIQNNLQQWWTNRFKAIFSMVDIVRVDHFRGFEAYWSIPATHKTAEKGKWIKGPGKKFFDDLQKQLGTLDIIAEDLGEITPEVVQLREDLDFPGMKILQFAFDKNRENAFLPFNYTGSNSVTYTGTHDNDTTVGWFLSNQLNDKQRLEIKRYCNKETHDIDAIHKDFIYLALSSISNYAIIPLQDILGFGNDCKMNSPGSSKGNWSWRCAQRFLTTEISNWLYAQCELFGRTHSPEKGKEVKQQSQL
jgi:4-alpha-glucanotransferase